ncbi:MAG: phosphatase PAP2 family protein [Candidatus Kariarchaeaceae archaeon]|jgi:membrane-associated phospholipid phosphatase
MTDLPWNSGIVEWFVGIRIPIVTSIFQFFTFLGGEQGYILLIIFLYWFFSKRAAIRVVFPLLASAYVNHVLKIMIRNPRPFVTTGTYEQNWAVVEGDVEDLVNSYSTPSGHAQFSATFWGQLHAVVRTKLSMILLPVMVFLIGISRVYLGVHYLEDVILGWIVGFIIVLLAMRYEERFADAWNARSQSSRLLLAMMITTISWVIAGYLSEFSADGEMFATLGGMLMGIVLGITLDTGLQYEPKMIASSVTGKLVIIIGRVIVGLLPVFISLLGLDVVFGMISGDDSLIGFLLRYVRYTFVGFSGTYIAPFLFMKLGLAKK